MNDSFKRSYLTNKSKYLHNVLYAMTRKMVPIRLKIQTHLKEAVKNLHYDNCYLTKAHAIFFQSCRLAFKSTVSKSENSVAQ